MEMSAWTQNAFLTVHVFVPLNVSASAVPAEPADNNMYAKTWIGRKFRECFISKQQGQLIGTSHATIYLIEKQKQNFFPNILPFWFYFGYDFSFYS